LQILDEVLVLIVIGMVITWLLALASCGFAIVRQRAKSSFFLRFWACLFPLTLALILIDSDFSLEDFLRLLRIPVVLVFVAQIVPAGIAYGINVMISSERNTIGQNYAFSLKSLLLLMIWICFVSLSVVTLNSVFGNRL
jgi:hypothetical protein